ncbi:ABC transporter permease [Martelella endophytica]|uniref:ABC transporter permease n=1 Tax=Martelella endophytica TaxID=1486262 RepID=UPI0005F17719|nr:ABC transporter permease [Martelella endophytica]
MSWSNVKKHLTADGPLFVIAIGIFVLMTFMNAGRFLTIGNVTSMAYQLPILAFLSIGMMVTMLTGGINLAIVSTANFVGIITALTLQGLTQGDPASASLAITGLAMLCGLVAGLLSGALMGFFIAYLEVPAILASLGMMMLLNGINILLTKGYTLSGFPDSLLFIGNGMVFGIPFSFLMLIVVVALMAVLIARMPFGFNLYTLGANPVAARFSNISVRAVLMWEYVLSSLFSALTAFVMIGQFNSVKSNYAQSYVLVTVLACFLGGVDPFGGAGRLRGVVLAVIILQMISTGVNLMRVDPFFVTAMWGAIILVLIVFNHFKVNWRGLLGRSPG